MALNALRRQPGITWTPVKRQSQSPGSYVSGSNNHPADAFDNQSPQMTVSNWQFMSSEPGPLLTILGKNRGTMNTTNNRPGDQLNAPEVLALEGPAYDLMFQHNPTAMYVYDEATLAFLAVNQAAVQQYGYSVDEFRLMTLQDIRPPEEVPALLEAVRNQKDLILAAAGTWHHRKQNGELIAVEITASAVMFAGKPARLVLAHDVTHRSELTEALAQTDARLKFLLASTPAIIYSCQAHPPYAATFVADSVKDVLGFEPREFTEDPAFWANHVHPDDLGHLMRGLQVLSERGQHVHRYRFQGRDGVYRWMRDDLRLVRHESGEPREILGCWLDITERKNAEEELKKHAELLELSPDAVLVRNMHDQITHWNRGAQELYGWTADEALGRSPQELLKTRFPQPLAEITARLHRDGHWEGELTHITRDGRQLVVSSRWALQLDKEGVPLAVLEINTNITERKRTEAALRLAHDQLELRVQERTAQLSSANVALVETEERFNQLAQNIQEVFWLRNPTMSEVIYVNPAFEKIWGRRCAELYQRPEIWFEAIHPADRPRMDEVFLNHNDAVGFEYEYRVVQPGGDVRWVLDRGFPVRDSRRVLYRYAGIALDITDRKELESRLLAISEREQRRIGQDLHDDLCQQLAGIEFLSNVLRHQLNTDDDVRRASEISELIRTAIDHTRRLAHGLSPVELTAEGLMLALQSLASRTSELFELQCTFHCPSAVLLKDPEAGTHLYRITQEAVTNSIKHGRAKHISIHLSSSERAVLLTISDDGRGLRRPAARQGGMGLRIMQYRASSMSGSCVVQSSPQGGTTVTCIIPTDASPANLNQTHEPHR
jgi:PAS domain S-box-containing protein